MKEITKQSTNKVNISGKVLGINIREGKTKDGKNYVGGKVVVQVNQTYFGNEELSEVSVGFFSTALTNKGTVNPAYESIQDLKNLKTAQTVGLNGADMITINGASLRENMFVAKNSNQLIDTWDINASFFKAGADKETASFAIDVYIMDKTEELDKEGVETGRLIIKGGIVQYGGRLDIVNFYAEEPEVIDYINRNWEPDTTVQIRGRVRMTKKEKKPTVKTSSWGEEIPEDTSTQFVNELIICTGDEYEEEVSYDPTDIKKAFSERKARIEQMRMDASNGSKASTSAPAAPAASKKKMYDWED